MLNETDNSTRTSIPVLLEPVDTWYWVLRAIIAILAITGNGLVIYLIVFKRRLRVTSNWFVLSLALADFCIALFVSTSGLLCTFYLRCDWRLQNMSYNFLLFASTLNLWAMAIDRYIGILHPLRYNEIMTAGRVLVLISLSWGISFVGAFVRLLWLQEGHFNQKIDKYYRLTIDLLFGFVSCIVLVAIYLRILIISRTLARKAATQLAQLSHNYYINFRKTQARGKKSTKVLGIVILLFVFCSALSIYISVCLIFKCHLALNSFIRQISLLMVHLNTALNFVVYAFMKNDIRLELKSMC